MFKSIAINLKYIDKFASQCEASDRVTDILKISITVNISSLEIFGWDICPKG